MKTTTAAPTAAGTILAIDLGRYKSVACAYDRATTGTRFHSVASTRREVAHLLARYPGALVVVEACANAGWVHDLARERGLAVKVANTNGEAWKFKHLKRKTDRDDARRLAELEALGQLPTVALPDPATRASAPANLKARSLSPESMSCSSSAWRGSRSRSNRPSQAPCSGPSKCRSASRARAYS